MKFIFNVGLNVGNVEPKHQLLKVLNTFNIEFGDANINVGEWSRIKEVTLIFQKEFANEKVAIKFTAAASAVLRQNGIALYDTKAKHGYVIGFSEINVNNDTTIVKPVSVASFDKKYFYFK